ncbi:MAG: thiol:disulfide interchange protein DsbA/DsbL, partial [Methylococcales bacterium]|nr:thiol:disulfide interchange protein DsbA/DsbL [Methylococcales bacterium]
MKPIIKLILLLISGIFFSMAQANPPGLEKGFHYQEIVPNQPTTDATKIEVIELFWYGCPHCYSLEPYLKRWLAQKPDDVKFIQIPVQFRADWTMHAKMYFTAKYLGILNDIHETIFDAIHMGKKKFKTVDSVRTFFKEHGVSEKDFNKTFKSFAVRNQIVRTKKLARLYGVNGVPALIVNGKYR